MHYFAALSVALVDSSFGILAARREKCSRCSHRRSMQRNLEHSTITCRLATFGVCLSLQCTASGQCGMEGISEDHSRLHSGKRGHAYFTHFYLITNTAFQAQLNSIYVVACVLLYVGVVVYKYYLINWSWRTVYIVTTVLNGIFSFLQVLLILGITFGLSNFVFALGDDAFAELIGGIQFLPTSKCCLCVLLVSSLLADGSF